MYSEFRQSASKLLITKTVLQHQTFLESDVIRRTAKTWAQKRPCYAPPTDAVGALPDCATTQGVRTQGTMETTQAVRQPVRRVERGPVGQCASSPTATIDSGRASWRSVLDDRVAPASH